jgi:hypothetical protein
LIICGLLLFAFIIIAASHLVGPTARVPAAAAAARSLTEPTLSGLHDPPPIQVDADAPPGVLALDPIPRSAADANDHYGYNFFVDVKLAKLPARGYASYTVRLTLTDAANLPLYSRSGRYADLEGRLRATRQIVAVDGEPNMLRTSLFVPFEELVLPVGQQVLNLTATLVDDHGKIIGRPALARWHHDEFPSYITHAGLIFEPGSLPGERKLKFSIDFMCPPMSGGRGQLVAHFPRPGGAPAAHAASREQPDIVTDFTAPPARQICHNVIWTVPPDRLATTAPQLHVELRLRNAATGEPLGSSYTISAQPTPQSGIIIR